MYTNMAQQHKHKMTREMGFNADCRDKWRECMKMQIRWSRQRALQLLAGKRIPLFRKFSLILQNIKKNILNIFNIDFTKKKQRYCKI